MQRQKSIFSSFRKPSPAGQSGSAGELKCRGVSQFPSKQSQNSDVCGSSVEVPGIDTPPEKEPRKVLPTSFLTNAETSGSSSLFSSIMHKFVKVEDKGKGYQRNQVADNSMNVEELPKVGLTAQPTEKANAINVEDVDDLRPETPATRPGVSRLKRIQDYFPKFGDKKDSSLLESSKRLKLLQESTIGNNTHRNDTDVASKFEWLDPSRIRDANGRRPSDSLYDKKTLYIPPDVLRTMSASQKQYWSVKCQYMDVVLFFKVGKFYELYEIDAEVGHKELDWKMTVSGVGKCRQVGISESGIDDAVQKLVARGYKVGRMEQLETSEQAKARGANSVIRRKLVEVITPSTTVDGNIGPDAVHLLAIKEGNYGVENGSTAYGFAFVDCAALKFWVGCISDDATCSALGALLMQVSPKEVIYESRGLSREAHKALKKYSSSRSTAVQLSLGDPTDFLDASEVKNMIQSHGYFKGSPNSYINAFDGMVHHDIAVCAFGGLVSHMSRLMLEDILQSGDVLPYQVYQGCLRIDGQTLVNLEIFSNNSDGGSSGTFYKYLDNCVTSSGKRLLRSWICHPLKDVDSINNRLDVVEKLMSHSEIMLIIAQYLRKLPDLERLLGRVKASIQSSASLVRPMIGKKVLKQRVKAFGTLVKGLRGGMDLLGLLQKDADMVSPLSKVFKLPILSGTNRLDEFLTQFEAAIDSDFPNYQNHDLTDTDAETLSILIELFIEKASQWSQVIHALNCIDVLRSFAVTASLSSGTMARPVVLPQSKTITSNQETGGPILKITGLWHPFALGESGVPPVPNNIFLGEGVNGYHPRALLLTGPNMGGKSTLLRASCLAVILAQLGSFVPSETCVISLVDTIFTRLGATDRIMTGESTFLVECSETASVLQNATQDSLVLLDELGRGTSTFDGYAIAYAVFRHLVEKVHCRLLFATHYHPLTKEFASHPHVTLQHMACSFNSKSKGEQELVFLYRLTNGACPESYGMQVAIMAGIPENVVEDASKAAQVMKRIVGESFRSSEQRSEFSTLHEEWLRTLVNLSQVGNCDYDDGDAYDTLFCLWHELKNSYGASK
ncbi:MUTS homolog 7, ARABIDOPSIS THALIANA MUTS HOMOLOG 7, MUTS HOMOLOG 6-2 [Hibiscus trionum]|uniref:MUTS homolog 7, ARABIDOPSIS THALIANA MUTS HOMOLOG 7, MUTS HOMOLOG 6-2 n=1 Tax=Hibiscus trionum TaxID=183268 RepID=A0A9W7MEZ6_HIBTR|nr:MUTS homolog 7, ARABIDOPSIS THALIANA MUTS HOMOLOG 7, MUTS HOMOLOG 6-2 [Hibiscus trionum]